MITYIVYNQEHITLKSDSVQNYHNSSDMQDLVKQRVFYIDSFQDIQASKRSH